MAPEVFAGGDVSPRADVFGLAATLWTLLIGKPPGYDDPRSSPTSSRRHPRLEQAIRAGMEFIPERRIASVERSRRRSARRAGRGGASRSPSASSAPPGPRT